jgi:hypothetical protein
VDVSVAAIVLELANPRIETGSDQEQRAAAPAPERISVSQLTAPASYRQDGGYDRDVSRLL